MSPKGWIPGLQLYPLIGHPNKVLSVFRPPTRPSPASSHQESFDSPSTEGLTTVKTSPGKGLGLFTTTAVPAHTPLLEDQALISLHAGEDLLELISKYEVLEEAERTLFDALSPREDTTRDAALSKKLAARGLSQPEIQHLVEVQQRFMNNAYHLEDSSTIQATLPRTGSSPQPLRAAIFPAVARINHSCVPNAHVHYDPVRRAQIVYTLRPLPAGTEVCIAYFDLTLPREARKAKAHAQWGFDCGCAGCTAAQDADASGDERETLLEAARAARQLGSMGQETPQRMTWATEIARRVAVNESLHPVLPHLMNGANRTRYEALGRAQTLQGQFNNDLLLWDDGLESYYRAVNAELNITGPRSPSLQQRYTTLQKAQERRMSYTPKAHVQVE